MIAMMKLIRLNSRARRVASLIMALAFVIIASAPGMTQPKIPSFWDANERLPAIDIQSIPRLRFLTTVDFPPFNFLNSTGAVSGFHVDLARAICKELSVLEKCQIQALPWDELTGALDTGQGEAIIAGLAVTAATREQFDFTRPYLQFPARLVTQRTRAVENPAGGWISEKRIGVISGSAHERMLRSYFPTAQTVTYSRPDWMYQDLKDSKLDGMFGDGMRLSFWLAGTEADDCCRFAGGPYLSNRLLGNGLAIAVSKTNPQLADAFNFALREIDRKGIFAELYLRYFPISFY